MNYYDLYSNWENEEKANPIFVAEDWGSPKALSDIDTILYWHSLYNVVCSQNRNVTKHKQVNNNLIAQNLPNIFTDNADIALC